LPYESLRVNDDIMRASCILHNMLLMECDGLHDIGEYEDDWMKYFLSEAEIAQPRDLPEFVDGVIPPTTDLSYHEKRDRLVEHLQFLHDSGDLFKFKTADQCRPNRRVL
jgi:hypothetical protein